MNRRDLLKALVATGAAAGLAGIYFQHRHGEHAPRVLQPQQGAGKFSNQLVDVTRQAGILLDHNSGAFGKKYLPETLGSGCAFIDYDNDGHGEFRDIAGLVGASFAMPKVARGCAYGDFDNDGDLDVLITTDNGPAYLYRNDGGANHSIRFRTIGVQSNRDAIGTNIRIWAPQDMRWLAVKSGSSYLSCPDRRITFGLGEFRRVDRTLVEWPSGQKQELGPLAAGHTYVVEEGKGVIEALPYQQFE